MEFEVSLMEAVGSGGILGGMEFGASPNVTEGFKGLRVERANPGESSLTEMLDFGRFSDRKVVFGNFLIETVGFEEPMAGSSELGHFLNGRVGSSGYMSRKGVVRRSTPGWVVFGLWSLVKTFSETGGENVTSSRSQPAIYFLRSCPLQCILQEVL